MEPDQDDKTEIPAEPEEPDDEVGEELEDSDDD